MKPLTIFLTTWWTIVFVLIALQAYFMTKSVPFTTGAFLFILLPTLITTQLPKKISKKTIQRMGISFGALHLIPLFLQFLGIIKPGMDNIITAFFGVLFIYDNYTP